ncbi:MAG: thiamine phosphate synthase [Epsilonproteobacteria bacterium]|jgi:thiamine-phosphate pyrophosphorylase|nr:thiamine phosphate synthase [Campylobacterota bacterium]NPA88770.1 thiamine phosphate synthase [Campylobacterota bacterium]
MALYGLLDWALLEKFGVSVEEWLQGAKGLKVKVVQYRDKSAPLEIKKERLEKIRELWKGILIINDEVELLPMADGIHIGQEDLEELAQKWGIGKGEVIFQLRFGGDKEEEKGSNFSHNSPKSWKQTSSTLPRRGRKIWRELTGGKGKIVGLSTHNLPEILEANRYPVSYIGLGAYRSTSTKKNAKVKGEEILELLSHSYHPVAVIGGVRLYDKIPSKFRVVGSDLCKFLSIQLKRRRGLKVR